MKLKSSMSSKHLKSTIKDKDVLFEITSQKSPLVTQKPDIQKRKLVTTYQSKSIFTCNATPNLKSPSSAYDDISKYSSSAAPVQQSNKNDNEKQFSFNGGKAPQRRTKNEEQDKGSPQNRPYFYNGGYGDNHEISKLRISERE